MKRGKEMSREQAIIERLKQEFTDFKERTIQTATKEEIFEMASLIDTSKVGLDYIVMMIESEQANLAVYEKLTNVYELFYNFQLDSFDGSITEETIEEFEEYMLKQIIMEERNKQAQKAKEEKDKPTFRYADLSKEAQRKAYAEALSYIEAEYADAEDQDVINNKEVHAKDEAENCAVYYVDGSLAELI